MGYARMGARLVAAFREPPAAAFGVSVWRDVQESGRNARRKQAGRVTAIGEDETLERAVRDGATRLFAASAWS